MELYGEHLKITNEQISRFNEFGVPTLLVKRLHKYAKMSGHSTHLNLRSGPVLHSVVAPRWHADVENKKEECKNYKLEH